MAHCQQMPNQTKRNGFKVISSSGKSNSSNNNQKVRHKSQISSKRRDLTQRRELLRETKRVGTGQRQLQLLVKTLRMEIWCRRDSAQSSWEIRLTQISLSSRLLNLRHQHGSQRQGTMRIALMRSFRRTLCACSIAQASSKAKITTRVVLSC